MAQIICENCGWIGQISALQNAEDDRGDCPRCGADLKFGEIVEDETPIYEAKDLIA